MNTLAAFLVCLWVTGWTIAAFRAGLKCKTALCSGRQKDWAEQNTYYFG